MVGPKQGQTTQERLKEQSEQYLEEYREQQRLNNAAMHQLTQDLIQMQSDYIKELEKELKTLKGEPTDGMERG